MEKISLTQKSVKNPLAQVLVLLFITLGASVAYAGVPYPNCQVLTPPAADVDDVLTWNATQLTTGGWVTSTGDMEVGDIIGGASATPNGAIGGNYFVCWSTTPFTMSNTGGGEYCSHPGSITVAAGQTYYQFNLDKTVSPAQYCQIAFSTATAAPSVGTTRIMSITPVSVPVFTPLGLLALLGGLFWLGRRRRACS